MTMHEVTVTLPDGSTRRVPAGTPVREVAEGISPRLAKAALAAAVGDQVVDLTHPLDEDASVRIITKDGPEALHLYRHSTAHLLAAAVTNLFPGAQCGIGPPTEDGFFYDFVVDRPFVPEDLEAIEAKMRELAAQDLAYGRTMMSKEEAKRYFTDRGEPLKVQLIEEKGGPVVSCYTIDDIFMDFCTGPHVPSSGRLKAFRVLTSSNAYWKGDAKNQPMQRIYGTAFFTNKALEEHLTRLEEAKKRDHRKLGRELGLFIFHKWAPGAAFWLAHGTTLWNLLAEYMRAMLFPAGYVELRTPLVFNKQLWETSGHWEHYRENMFLVESEGEPYGLKAMNCPGHMLVFASEVRSYRDLPIRYHDQSVLHRNEASGVLAGLTRARQFCQDDAHCFVTREQIADEVERLLRLVQRVYADFQLGFSVELSTRPETFLGETETWDAAEAQLKQALDASGQPYVIAEGEGNFYGPKIDFHVIDAIGRTWQCAIDPARLPAPGAVSAQIHRRRQRRTPSGRHPPGHFWQLRTVHRPAHRALCRSVPTVAGAGAGCRRADRRPPPRLCRNRRDASFARRASESKWMPDKRKWGIRSGRHSCARSRTCWSRATARRLRRPSRCDTAPTETRGHARWTTLSPARSMRFGDGASSPW